MDKQIQKLEKWIKKFMNQPKNLVVENLGKPNKKADSEIYFYNFYHFVIFKKTFVVFFDHDIVVDIMLKEYVFGIKVRNTYYFDGKNPYYRIDGLF